MNKPRVSAEHRVNVVVSSNTDIIGTITGPFPGRTVDVAGAVTLNGDPVNVHTYSVSRSIRNVVRARYMDDCELQRCTSPRGNVFYRRPETS